MKTNKSPILGILLGDVGAMMFYAGAILLFAAWAMHPHREKSAPLLTAAARVANGNTFADQAAEKVAPQLIAFANAHAEMRDMIVVVTGADNSSRLMTLSRTNTPPPVLYRVGAELLNQGADNLQPNQPTATQEEHAL